MADGSKMIARANICATWSGISWLNPCPTKTNFLKVGLFYGAGASLKHPCVRDEHVFVVGGGNSGRSSCHISSLPCAESNDPSSGNNLAATLSYII